MKSIPVECEGRSYKIHVGLGILPRTGRILKDLNLSMRLVVISNRQVLKLYGTFWISLSAQQGLQSRSSTCRMENATNRSRRSRRSTIDCFNCTWTVRAH